jgi:hypothetical protein
MVDTIGIVDPVDPIRSTADGTARTAHCLLSDAVAAPGKDRSHADPAGPSRRRIDS